VDVEVLKLGEELAPGHFGRREIAHDDVGDERGADGVGGAGGGGLQMVSAMFACVMLGFVAPGVSVGSG
jgi:hypothetical protein